MKSGTAGAASGCLIWAIVFGILGTCLGSLAMVVGGVTSFGINGNCAGTGGVYRVDRADDLNWLRSAYGNLLR